MMPGNSHNQSRIVTLAKSNLHPPAAGVTYDTCPIMELQMKWSHAQHLHSSVVGMHISV